VSTDIPAARGLLKAALNKENVHDIKASIFEALSLMTRVQNNPNPRIIALKVTSEIVREVKRLKAKEPTMTYFEIGLAVGINAGRVSEIINGHRTEESPTMKNDGRNRDIAKAKGLFDDS